MKLKVKKVRENATLPTYATKGSAAFDLTICHREIFMSGTMKVYFGLAFEIPDGYVGVIAPRSSITNTSFLLANSPCVIDSDYRGEVSAVFDRVRDNGSIHYRVGERAAQMLIVPIVQCDLEEVEELSQTDRGAGGYGSTGK